MVAFQAKPNLMRLSITARFVTGKAPGMAKSTTEVWVLASAPNAVDAPLKIFDCVFIWTWISSPITVSQVMF